MPDSTREVKQAGGGLANTRGHGHERPSFARICAIETPRNFTSLCRDLWPRTNSTRPRGQSKASASNRTSASLAAASTGGAVTLIRHSGPASSPSSVREARGWSLMASVAPSACAVRKPGSSGAWSDFCPHMSSEIVSGRVRTEGKFWWLTLKVRSDRSDYLGCNKSQWLPQRSANTATVP